MAKYEVGNHFDLIGEEGNVSIQIVSICPKEPKTEQQYAVNSFSCYKPTNTQPYSYTTTESFISRNFIIKKDL
jgi:hypothetical protein